MNKLKVAVLQGGPSEEHDISLLTGAGVVKALTDQGYVVSVVTISKAGVYSINGVETSLPEIAKTHDVAFLALHGAYGEDGTLQSELEALELPYTGSDSVGSKLAFDKAKSKSTLANAGITSPAALLISQSQIDSLSDATFAALPNTHGYVIKPNTSGSSCGTVLVDTIAELLPLVNKQLETYAEILVEEKIVGTEVTCGVVERLFSSNVTALPVVEIVPPETAAFFDREVKYNGETTEICPAQLKDSVAKEIQTAAIVAHTCLGLKQYSRSDFILRDNELFYLETNTLPGLTSESLLPKEVTAAGSNYEKFVAHLVADALR